MQQSKIDRINELAYKSLSDKENEEKKLINNRLTSLKNKEELSKDEKSELKSLEKRKLELKDKSSAGLLLTEEERKERDELRKEYIESYRKNLKAQLMSVKVVDEKGNDVTPTKLKEEQQQAEKDALDKTNIEFEGELS
jgi:uncharacterized protein YnzC (UPF0291/DUF896 family)